MMNFKLTWRVVMNLLKTVNKKKYYGSLLTTDSIQQRIYQILLKMLTFNALRRIQKYMTTDKKTRIFSSFIKSQSSYCPLAWMFCTKHFIGRINNILLLLMPAPHSAKLHLWFWTTFWEFKWKISPRKCIELLTTEVYQ